MTLVLFTPMRPRIIFVCLALICLSCIAYSQDKEDGKDTPLQNFDPTTIAVELIPDKTAIMLNEGVFLSFVVKNNSNLNLQVLSAGDYQNRLGRPESFKVQVTDKLGNKVPQPNVGITEGGTGTSGRLPPSGTYSFKLFLPHWATFEKPGHYKILATRTLNLLSGGVPWSRNTTDIPVQAETEIDVTPPDKEQLGKLIDEWGKKMTESANGFAGHDAIEQLRNINDERVIPYFLLALKSKNYDKKFYALEALSKYNNDAAFDGIKQGLATKWDDFDHVTTKEGAEQLAENIRHSAGLALLSSPHPEAIPFLLTQQNNPSKLVRLDVVHALGEKVDRNKATPALKEMANDTDPWVSGEAKRYLNQLQTK